MIISPRSQSHHTKSPSSPAPYSPPHQRRPSLSHMTRSNPLAWMSRTSTSSSSSGHGQTTLRISEPTFNAALDIVSPQRCGALGTGAKVVRTPRDALCTEVVKSFGDDEVIDVRREHAGQLEERQDHYHKELPTPPEASSPLPPVQTFEEVQVRGPRKPTREPPAPPAVPASPPRRRPSLKRGNSPPVSEYTPPMPPLPLLIPDEPQPQPFSATLLSPAPSFDVDPASLIVTLETCTTTHRTTLSTLTSRPSHLARFLTRKLRPQYARTRDADAESLYSDAGVSPAEEAGNPFSSIFHNHLASAGLVPSSTSMHVFLDRPSEPYTHILAYLRTSASAAPELPRGARLSSSGSAAAVEARVDALLDLRDEARFLGLDELDALCTAELRARPTLRKSASSSSRSSASRSIHTPRESESIRSPVRAEQLGGGISEFGVCEQVAPEGWI